MKITLLGITRSPQFSPNSTGRDSAIFDAVTARLLRDASIHIDVLSEDFLFDLKPDEFALVYSMARSKTAIDTLCRAAEQSALPILNSPQAIRRFNDRCELTRVLREAGVPLPPTEDINPQQYGVTGTEHYPLWLKRADMPTQTKDDVRFVGNKDELRQAIDTLAEKGCTKAQLVDHVDGDLIKFYGVEGTEFFSYEYPTRNGCFSKFGLEEHNGEAQEFDFSADALHQAATLSARATGFVIYGGDAVVRSDGTFAIIDFNDWPSFSSVRREAAKAIAKRIHDELAKV